VVPEVLLDLHDQLAAVLTNLKRVIDVRHLIRVERDVHDGSLYLYYFTDCTFGHVRLQNYRLLPGE
jgi:hypothetical protein